MPPETPEQRRERLYRAEVGDPRNLPDDHPDVWQWRWTGAKNDAERLDLLERVRWGDAPDVEQEALF